MINKGALEGVKVLDFGWSGAGPITTKILGNFGAKVVKVESRKRPDLLRMSAPFKDDIADLDRSGFFLWSNTSKYSIELDITKRPGADIVRKLVNWSDVVLENFSPSVMLKLGFNYEEIIKIKPNIIMASLSIVGQAGPLVHFRGFGNAAQAMSGHSSLIGWADREPSITPIFWADVTQPILVAAVIVAALAYKNKTGRGQYLDFSQVEIMTQLVSPAVLDYVVNGRQMPRMGNRSMYASPHGAFPCKGEDKWCTIAVFTDDEWRQFCTAIGTPAWSLDKKFSNLSSRKQNEEELEKLISEWTLRHSPAEVMHIMQRNGVSAGVVQDAKEVFDQDPQVKERGCFIKLNHPVMGDCNLPYPPIRLTKTPAELHPSPCLGEHTEFICTEFLGMSDEELLTLLET